MSEIATAQTHSEFLIAFSETLENQPVDSAFLFAMQLEITPEDTDASPVLIAINALRSAAQKQPPGKFAIAIDKRYAETMTRVGIRDIHRLWPLSKDQRLQRAETARCTQMWLDQLTREGLILQLTQRRQTAHWASWARRIASTHPLQPWSTIHQKGGFIIAPKDADSCAILSTGNLTTSDCQGMNNLALRFDGTRGHGMAGVLRQILTSPDTLLRTSGGHIWQQSKDDWVQFIHDYSNAGHPARLSFIHETAEKMIDPQRDEYIAGHDIAAPQPKTILLISQYELDGQLAKLLKTASQRGCHVIIPRQPANDYRQNAFPYSLQSKFSPIRRRPDGILTPERNTSSHVKALVVTYDNNTAAILFGSDNYLTHLQKLVRNEEMAVHLDIRPDNAAALATYTKFCNTLEALGEIDTATRRALDLATL